MIDLKAIREFAWESIGHGRSHMLPPQTVIALLDRLESAEKDAARYRWITADHTDHETRLIASTIGQYIALRGKGATDAAIDAAMGEQT